MTVDRKSDALTVTPPTHRVTRVLDVIGAVWFLMAAVVAFLTSESV